VIDPKMMTVTEHLETANVMTGEDNKDLQRQVINPKVLDHDYLLWRTT